MPFWKFRFESLINLNFFLRKSSYDLWIVWNSSLHSNLLFVQIIDQVTETCWGGHLFVSIQTFCNLSCVRMCLRKSSDISAMFVSRDPQARVAVKVRFQQNKDYSQPTNKQRLSHLLGLQDQDQQKYLLFSGRCNRPTKGVVQIIT